MARPRTFDEDKALDAAVACFWTRGYAATSVRDLAQHMGIGCPSLYNAYGDKRTLFAAALARYADRSMRARLARAEPRGGPTQAIAAFFAEIIDRSLKDPQRKGCLLVNSVLDVAPHDAGIGRLVGGYLEEIRTFLRRNVVAAQAASQMNADLDPDEVADHLLGVLLGIRVLARTRTDRRRLEAIARPALRLLEPPGKRRTGCRRRRAMPKPGEDVA
jgi:TetR/AcrR family transcriptional repressor of nem operon